MADLLLRLALVGANNADYQVVEVRSACCVSDGVRRTSESLSAQTKGVETFPERRRYLWQYLDGRDFVFSCLFEMHIRRDEMQRTQPQPVAVLVSHLLVMLLGCRNATRQDLGGVAESDKRRDPIGRIDECRQRVSEATSNVHRMKSSPGNSHCLFWVMVGRISISQSSHNEKGARLLGLLLGFLGLA